MSVSVDSVVERIQTTIQDTTGVRWPISQLNLWINDAQRELCLLKPDASATNEIVTLATGTKQSIPSAGSRLLRVVRNYSHATYTHSTDTPTGKRSIRIVDREVLDSQTPDWHDPSLAAGDAAHGTTVKHYAYDEYDPRNYYVYPGVAGNAYIEIIYSKNPTTVVAQDGATPWAVGAQTFNAATPIYRIHNGNRYELTSDTASTGDEPGTADGDAHWKLLGKINLDVPDIFANAIMNYAIYMAYMKDADFAGNRDRAATHYGLFTQSVTQKGQIDTITTPNFDTAIKQPPPIPQ